MRSCFDLLTDEEKTLLLEPVDTRMAKMIQAVEANQALLDILLLSQQEELLIDEVRIIIYLLHNFKHLNTFNY